MFKITKRHTGVDDVPLTEANRIQMGKELWLEIMIDDDCKDTIITFQEYVIRL